MNVLDKLKQQGYTEEDLEASNPYNKWMQENPSCPKCGETDTSHIHQSETFSTPECDYWLCTACEHTWGVE